MARAAFVGDLSWVDSGEGHEFVDNLEDAANDSGLKLADLLARLGISRSTTTRWVNSTRKPRRRPEQRLSIV